MKPITNHWKTNKNSKKKFGIELQFVNLKKRIRFGRKVAATVRWGEEEEGRGEARRGGLTAGQTGLTAELAGQVERRESG